MTEFMTAGGAKAVIRPAGFKEAMRLKSAIMKEISKADFDLSLGGIDLADIDVSVFAKLVAAIDSSEEVNKAVFDCLIRCTYNGDKITEATFENVAARSDYYEIVLSCVKENMLPFFAGLFSKLSPFLAALPAQQAEKAQK